MQLTFLGAAGTVTGSKYLLCTDSAKVLVDCGLYQGVKSLRLRNWKAIPVDAASLDCVVLTHAHIDHSGFLPALVRDGFRGPIYCTPPTHELCQILLPDAGRLQEEDARYANRKGFSKHRVALPLYTEEDAGEALRRFTSVPLGEWIEHGSVRFQLHRAGHILGAAGVSIRSNGRTLRFSGDLGRSDDLIMYPPDAAGPADWIVVESTYGDRNRTRTDPFEWIASTLRETIDRGGILLIPSFAVGRAQTVLFCLHEIFRNGLAPEVPVYVNSPMATSVTELFRHSDDYHRLTSQQCNAVCDIARYVRSVDDSRELASKRKPMVIISASGMATGGRVLHHLKALLPERRNTVLFPGFQAPGTRGASLVAGAESVKIHGGYVPVEAEIRQFDVLSAHADQGELLDWVGSCTKRPERVFVTHGEPVAADSLRRRIQDDLDFAAHVPEYLETIELV
jgi:metallo-beta-lactamase family protein